MGDLRQIMIASANVENRQKVVRTLEGQGLDPICVSTVVQCQEALAKERVGLVFCDRFFADGDYHDVLAAAASRSANGEVRVVLMSDLAGREQYESVKRQGIFEIIRTPCRPTDVEWMVIQARRDEHLRASPHPSIRSEGGVIPASRSAAAGTT